MSVKKDEQFRVQLGQRIKQLRLAHCLTQAELGRRVGVSYSQIQKYENGSNYIFAGRLYDLAKALSVDVARFFTDMPNLHETSSNDGDVLALITKYSKIKSDKSRNMIYLLVKSFSQK